MGRKRNWLVGLLIYMSVVIVPSTCTNSTDITTSDGSSTGTNLAKVTSISTIDSVSGSNKSATESLAECILGLYRIGTSTTCNGICRCKLGHDKCRVDGSCEGGCHPRFTGSSCSECAVGLYGFNCLLECHCNIHKSCEQESGKCKNGCAPGWMGAGCRTSCPYRYFGLNCAKQCHCLSVGETCIRPEWDCKHGCAKGYTGKHCDQECAPKTYGENCSMTCHCSGGSLCDRFDGKCASGDCAEFYHGPGCSQYCPSLTFGPDCNLTCHCLQASEPCHRTSGKCLSGCARLFSGTNCQTRGSSGTDVKEKNARIQLTVVIASIVGAFCFISLLVILAATTRSDKKKPSATYQTNANAVDTSFDASPMASQIRPTKTFRSMQGFIGIPTATPTATPVSRYASPMNADDIGNILDQIPLIVNTPSLPSCVTTASDDTESGISSRNDSTSECGSDVSRTSRLLKLGNPSCASLRQGVTASRGSGGSELQLPLIDMTAESHYPREAKVTSSSKADDMKGVLDHVTADRENTELTHGLQTEKFIGDLTGTVTDDRSVKKVEPYRKQTVHDSDSDTVTATSNRSVTDVGQSLRQTVTDGNSKDDQMGRETGGTSEFTCGDVQIENDMSKSDEKSRGVSTMASVSDITGESIDGTMV